MKKFIVLLSVFLVVALTTNIVQAGQQTQKVVKQSVVSVIPGDVGSLNPVNMIAAKTEIPAISDVGVSNSCSYSYNDLTTGENAFRAKAVKTKTDSQNTRFARHSMAQTEFLGYDITSCAYAKNEIIQLSGNLDANRATNFNSQKSRILM